MNLKDHDDIQHHQFLYFFYFLITSVDKKQSIHTCDYQFSCRIAGEHEVTGEAAIFSERNHQKKGECLPSMPVEISGMLIILIVEI